MLTVFAICMPVVKLKPWSAGSASHCTVSTDVNLGKLSVDKIVSSLSVNDPPMVVRLSPESSVICVTLLATKSPVMCCTPLMAMLSVTPVARAMLPLKVEHAARADASPPLWMVVVAALLHDDCAAGVSGHVSSCLFDSHAHLLPVLRLPKLARDIWPPFV